MEEELVNCWSSRQMAVIHLCVFFRGSVRFFWLRSPHGESFSLKTCSTVGYGLKKSFWKIKDKPGGFRCIVLRILLRSLSLRKKVLRTKVEKEKKTSSLKRGTRRLWSGKRDSNSRPQPWQGCALPTELFPQWLERFK